MLRADLIDFTLHKPFLKTTSPVNLLKVFNTRVFSLALIRTLLTRGLILLYATFIIVFLVIGKYSLIPFQLAVMKSLLNYVLLEIGRNSPFLKPKDISEKNYCRNGLCFYRYSEHIMAYVMLYLCLNIDNN